MSTELESGLLKVEVGRKHGISHATFYKSNAKYLGMKISPELLVYRP